MSEKKVPLFSDVLDMIKNEQARLFPSFFHSPHSKQEVEKANKTVHRVKTILEEVTDTVQTVQK